MREALIMHLSIGLLIFAAVLVTPSAAKELELPQNRIVVVLLILFFAVVWPFVVYRNLRK